MFIVAEPSAASAHSHSLDYNLGQSMRYTNAPNIYMRAKSKSSKMAVTLVIVFLVCWVPYYLVRCVMSTIVPCKNIEQIADDLVNRPL